MPKPPQAGQVPHAVAPLLMAGELRFMHNRRLFSLHQQVPLKLQPQTQIDILAIHVKLLVESTDISKNDCRKEQTSCIDPINSGWQTVIRGNISTQQRRGGRQRPLMVLPLCLWSHLHRVRAPRTRLSGSAKQRSERVLRPVQIGIEYCKKFCRSGTRLLVTESLIVIGTKPLRYAVMK